MARLCIIDRLTPGTNLARQVEVSNTTRSIVDVAVYVAGASLGRDGFTFAPGRSQSHSPAGPQ